MDFKDDSTPLAKDHKVISIIDYEQKRREKRDTWFDRVVKMSVVMVILLYIALFLTFS